MKDIPIIYSAPMVLALLDGRKTMTRRLAWGKVRPRKQDLEDAKRAGCYGIAPMPKMTNWCAVKQGDRLWVKENFWRYGRWVPSKTGGKVTHSFEPLPWDGRDAMDGRRQPNNLEFAAGEDETHPRARGKFGSTEPGWHLRPNIFLERKHSRLTLSVVSKKIERLQDISEEDAKAEGCGLYVPGHGWITPAELAEGYANYLAPRMGFEDIWRTLHGPAAWDANPEVVAISFVVHHCNIDALPRAA